MTIIGLIAIVVLVLLLVYIAQQVVSPWNFALYIIAALLVILAILLILGVGNLHIAV